MIWLSIYSQSVALLTSKLLANFNPAESAIRVESITEFENLLSGHEVDGAYWHWTQLAFPFQIVYGKIWFNGQDTTYYLGTTW